MHSSWYQEKVDFYYKKYQELIEGGETQLALLAFAEMNNYKRMLNQTK